MIDGVMMWMCLVALISVSGLLEALLIKITSGFLPPQSVGGLLLVAIFFNLFWVYYLSLGLVTGGSVGMRLVGLRIVNSSGSLRLIDLMKRNIFPILIGVGFTIYAAFVVLRSEEVHQGAASFLLNTYPLFMVVYLVSANIAQRESAYDDLCRLKVVRTKRNPSP